MSHPQEIATQVLWRVVPQSPPPGPRGLTGLPLIYGSADLLSHRSGAAAGSPPGNCNTSFVARCATVSARPSLTSPMHLSLIFQACRHGAVCFAPCPKRPFPTHPHVPVYGARAQHSYMAVGYYCRIARTPGWPPGGRLPKSLRRDQLYTIDPKRSRTLLF